MQRPKTILRRFIGLTVLSLLFGEALGDGVYLTDMQVRLTPESISLLTDPSRSSPDAQPGDVLEYVLSARVADAEAGPSAYLTAYPSPGVEVLGAWFVTGQSGTASRPPADGGRGSDGWGPRGNTAPFGPPFVTSLTGRQNDLFGDTGIFYSTDSRTALFTDDGSQVVIAPTTGDPAGTGPSSNGYNVNDTFHDHVDAFNLWDADQVNAFGTGGTLGLTPANPAPASSATIVNADGQGALPFGTGSPVAGPDTAYQNDNTGNVGPWQRIRYPGSETADISDGPALDAGPLDSPDQLDASSLGFPLNGSGMSLPGNTNAIRWSTGIVQNGEVVYLKLRMRITASGLSATEGVIAHFEANGSDNWGSGSKDNPWRYFAPSHPVFGEMLFNKELVGFNGQTYTGDVIPEGSVLTYRIDYLNMNHIPATSLLMEDLIPTVIATEGCNAGNPTLSNVTNGVMVSVSAGTADCPQPGATLQFSNLPNGESDQLNGLRGGRFEYDLKLAESIPDGESISNTASFSASAAGSGTQTSTATTVTSTVGVLDTLTKTVEDLNGGDVAPGDLLRYTLSVANNSGETVSGLHLSDSFPAGLTNITLTGSPAAIATTMHGPPSGANSNGLLSTAEFSVNTSEQLVWTIEASVTSSSVAGDYIDNIATLDYADGSSDSASATLMVYESQTQAQGVKSLYLLESGDLSRMPANADSAAVQINKDGGLQTWQLQPMTTGPLTLQSGTIPVNLWLKAKKKAGDYATTVELSSIGATGTVIGTHTRSVALSKDNTNLYTFNVDIGSDVNLTAGSQLILKVTNNHSQDMQIFARLGSHSRVEPVVSTVINVDELAFYDAPYPDGAPVSTWKKGEILYIRADVSDPFGSADINDTLIQITDAADTVVQPLITMGTPVATFPGSKIFEFSMTLLEEPEPEYGQWAVNVTAKEGTEETISHTRAREFSVIPDGFSVSGRVFDDRDVNGQFDGDDAGLAGISVVLRDDVNGTCVSVITQASGEYVFDLIAPGDYTVVESADAAGDCPPTGSDAINFLSVTTNSQPVVVWNAAVSEVNFADTRLPGFAADSQQTADPGATVLHSHLFTAQANGAVVFEIVDSVAAPTNDSWSEVLYRDVNCDGALDAGDIAVAGSVDLLAGDSLCLLNKVFVPASAPAGAILSSTIEAVFSFDDPAVLNHGLVSTVSVQDVTVASVGGDGQLKLQKRVKNVSRDGPVDISNAALPGEVLRYFVSFANAGTSAIADLEIHDVVPAYSLLSGVVSCPQTLPDGITACTIMAPVAGDNAEGYTGSIYWKFDGALSAGATGSLTFDVLVD